jgi:hypothetical protein
MPTSRGCGWDADGVGGTVERTGHAALEHESAPARARATNRGGEHVDRPCTMPSLNMVTIRYLVVLLTIFCSACFGRGGGGLFLAALDTAIITAAIVSATEPPPPRIIFVPEARPGYAWQPGYWTLQDGQWAWVDGGWVALRPGYAWAPAHWERLPDGTWQLVRGQWVPAEPPPGPPPPAPPS